MRTVQTSPIAAILEQIGLSHSRTRPAQMRDKPSLGVHPIPWDPAVLTPPAAVDPRLVPTEAINGVGRYVDQLGAYGNVLPRSEQSLYDMLFGMRAPRAY